MKTNHLVVGILAHVDAGKTTLSEQLLFKTGAIAKAGRVDHKDTFLDTHSLERERGITIFSKQAIFSVDKFSLTLLDTPGHVDFGSEMERALQVLDYAILVINGSDGVQSHTKTLWRLLEKYHLPVFIFVNKMDQPSNSREGLFHRLKEKLSPDCIEFDTGRDTEFFYEEVAVRDEALMEAFLEGKNPKDEDIRRLIHNRQIFPCIFGSALKDWGVDELLDVMAAFMEEKQYPEEFAARVYKIGRDGAGQRLTYLKITGGSLKVKQLIEQKEGGLAGKADQLRIYNGSSYDPVSTALPGQVVALLGLGNTYAGQALGAEKENYVSSLQPVLTYGILLPEGENLHQAYEKLKILEEEDPNLHITWIEGTQEIHGKVMGEIQMQVLKQLARQRFGLDITFGSGQIVYKETIELAVEGVGHFEPLRHYAEVHVLLEPLPAGSGIQIDTCCSEDVLDRNWQRLILTHFMEKEHRGVLTGSFITDMKLTLLTGKAHNKHTEGGDFRQAAYRAIRQGLRKAKSILLEPVYEFNLELPTAMVGKAMADLQRMSADFELSVMEEEGGEEFSLISGTCPVITMQEYLKEVAAYTRGLGRLECSMKGYAPCHNQEEVVKEKGYIPEADLENPCGSVFCSHGSGTYVEWYQVEDYMHLEMVYRPAGFEQVEEVKYFPKKESVSRVIGTEEIDAILQKTYYSNQKTGGYIQREGWNRKRDRHSTGATTKIYKGSPRKEEYLLVDGYNIIFAWQELKELAGVSLDGARGKLLDLLCDYQAMRGIQLMVVFDAYRLQGHPVEVLDYNNIKVVYTREAETADQYIEKFAAKHAGEYRITVATSDGLEQIIIRGQGCGLLSARELWEDIVGYQNEFRQMHMKEEIKDRSYMKEILGEDILGQIKEGNQEG